MKRTGWNRFRAAGCCAALLVSLVLAGCSNTAAPASEPSTSAPSSQALSQAPASEAVPSGEDDTTPAPNGQVDGSENSFNGITDPVDAFAGCLGWGPGTAGTSLKSAASAAAMMDWAQENGAAGRSSDALNDTLSQWFDSLDTFDQENFAEAWPLIQETAQEILDDPDAVLPRLEDAGVQEAPSCSADDWSALAGALNAIVPEPQQ